MEESETQYHRSVPEPHGIVLRPVGIIESKIKEPVLAAVVKMGTFFLFPTFRAASRLQRECGSRAPSADSLPAFVTGWGCTKTALFPP